MLLMYLIAGILSGTLTWSDNDTEQTFTVNGVTSSSIVTVTWKKNDNGNVQVSTVKPTHLTTA